MQPRLIVLTALSMALGWRIRGQFGHEIGAAMAGALGAMAIVLLSGRADWRQRVHHFALFGALGWAFGGSISYMKVIGYCHSSDPATVLYGFTGVFLIGFLWAGLGGAGTALPALLDGKRLAGLYPGLAAVFAVWFAGDIAADLLRGSVSLYWFDSDWLPAALAAPAAAGTALARRRFATGASLAMHLALGWWASFLLLVVIPGWHLNPPRGDNWAGVIGVFAGLLAFCRRHGLLDLAKAAALAGVLGGAGFCLGQAIKLALISTGAVWGWHAVMEWFHGLFHGMALAVALLPLVRRAPAVPDRSHARWTDVFAVAFVLWAIPFLNFRRSPPLWMKQVRTLPEYAYGIAVQAAFAPSKGWIGWFDVALLAPGAVLVVLMIRHLRRPVALVPESWLGRGQLLYLVFLWTITVMSGAHEIPGFTPLSLALQWGVTMTAVACTASLLWKPAVRLTPAPGPVYAGGGRRLPALVLLAAAVSAGGGWAVKRALFGDAFAGYFYMDHIRFGPKNTNHLR